MLCAYGSRLSTLKVSSRLTPVVSGSLKAPRRRRTPSLAGKTTYTPPPRLWRTRRGRMCASRPACPSTRSSVKPPSASRCVQDAVQRDVGVWWWSAHARSSRRALPSLRFGTRIWPRVMIPSGMSRFDSQRYGGWWHRCRAGGWGSLGRAFTPALVC